MTRDEATADITAHCPWFDIRDLNDILDPSIAPIELETIVRVYMNAGVPAAGPSSWDTFLVILKACAEVAGAVLPIVGAIQSVYGLAKS